MLTIFLILAGIAGVFGLVTLIFSNSPDPKERASNAAGAAVGGAMMGVSCIFQLMLYGLSALVGLWLLSLIF